MAWRVARSLNVLRAQIDQASPNRNTASDGTIGDTSHSSTSDHAARDFPGWGNDIVTARDITHDPSRGADMAAVAEALRASRDGRIKYVIWGNRMYSSYATSGAAAWTWRWYSGAFHSHLHVSVVGDPRADLEHPWQIGAPDMTPEQAAALQRIDERLGTIIGDLDRAPSLGDTNHLKRRLVLLEAALARVAGVNYVDEAAIVDDVLRALADRDVQEITDSLRSALGTDKAREVGHLLADDSVHA